MIFRPPIFSLDGSSLGRSPSEGREVSEGREGAGCEAEMGPAAAVSGIEVGASERRSSPDLEARGASCEAMVGSSVEPVIRTTVLLRGVKLETPISDPRRLDRVRGGLAALSEP